MIIKQTPIPVVEGAAVNRTARPAVTDGVVDLILTSLLSGLAGMMDQ